MKTTTHHGKTYGLVCSSTSRTKINIYADILNKKFENYDYGKIKKVIKNNRNLILVDHITKSGKEYHLIYVKQPYDKLVHKVK